VAKQKKEGARDDLAEELRSLRGSDPEMASFASWQASHLAEPSLAGESGYSEPAAQTYLSAAEARQGLYAAGSGTLTQFNAIMAAIHGSVLASGAQGLLKASSATALLLHVLAAFILCWAARPIDRPRYTEGADVVDTYRNTADTFRNYRRGWRVTLVALIVSSVAAGLFVLNAFGITAPDLAAIWK
jgi:hypothetical protein